MTADPAPSAARGLGGIWNLLVGLGVLAVAVGLLLHGGSEEPRRFADLKPADPVRLEVASLELDAPVVPIQVGSDAVLDPPSDTLDVGWWDASAQPGRDEGQTVITGHTVHTGGGAMDRLTEIKPGAAVDVVTGAGRMRYRVQRVSVLSHDALAQASQRLFGQDDDSGRLVLVSCTDWDGTVYESNVVVTATPLGEPIAKTADAAGRLG